MVLIFALSLIFLIRSAYSPCLILKGDRGFPVRIFILPCNLQGTSKTSHLVALNYTLRFRLGFLD